jgi:uncharacterized protein (TIGR02145 family)
MPIVAKADNLTPINTDYNISDEADVIAIRILPNPNHYSAARWYQSQNFQGSPQSLLVDGYDAVRDGRTVYVNAANVDLASQTIYTNIYLISYNQSPDYNTVDVLGQIIKNWRFNSNLNTPGQCNISTLLCEQDTDCSESQSCVINGEAPGRCLPAEEQVCYVDSDCADGIYCSSLRAKVNRDVRRLGVLGDLREALSSFKQINGRYPVLAAGSYIPLTTTSVWPSWQSAFLPQIGATQSSLDPINFLGSCPGYDPITCWDATNNKFADPNPLDSEFELPSASHAFVYTSDANGSNYNLCASMETKSLGYNTAEGQLAESGCVDSGSAYVGSSSNEAPVLISTNLAGEQDKVFNGFIRVLDPENNTLNWSINTNTANWSGWSAAPILQDTANPNQKRLYAAKAGVPGVYNVSLNVNDGYGGTLATVTPIVIGNNPPLIQANDINYYPSVVLPLIINFSVTDNDQPVSYTFNHATWNSGPFDLLAPSHAMFLGSSNYRVGDTVHYTLKYNLLTSNSFPTDTNFVYTIGATDKYSNNSEKQININVKADPPALDFNCNENVRVGSQYYCGLGWGKQGDHTITYSVVGSLPPGLTITEASNLYEPDIENDISTLDFWQKIRKLATNMWHKISLRATAAPMVSPFYVIQGTPITASTNNIIKVRAENEFGAVSEKEFVLNINTYCGDGLLQKPNTEARGGFYNDGFEDCDGNQGVVTSAGKIPDSNPNYQYGCTTKSGDTVPYPIPNYQYFCTFTDADDENGGGFCGDGICQAQIKINGTLTSWENQNNCPEDCSEDGGKGNDGPTDDGKGNDGPTDDGKGNDGPGDEDGDVPGEDGSSDCGVIEYEGQTYQTVMIGEQCWMAENLNVGTRINSNADQNSQGVIQKYCYDDLESNCDIYGGLYQINAATRWTSQGICPNGWHIPLDEEFWELEYYATQDYSGLACSLNQTSLLPRCQPAGESLRAIDFGGTDLFGFNALESGFIKNNNGNSQHLKLNQAGYFWTPSIINNYPNLYLTTTVRAIGDWDKNIVRFSNFAYDAFSIRCVKD